MGITGRYPHPGGCPTRPARIAVRRGPPRPGRTVCGRRFPPKVVVPTRPTPSAGSGQALNASPAGFPTAVGLVRPVRRSASSGHAQRRPSAHPISHRLLEPVVVGQHGELEGDQGPDGAHVNQSHVPATEDRQSKQRAPDHEQQRPGDKGEPLMAGPADSIDGPGADGARFKSIAIFCAKEEALSTLGASTSPGIQGVEEPSPAEGVGFPAATSIGAAPVAESDGLDGALAAGGAHHLRLCAHGWPAEQGIPG